MTAAAAPQAAGPTRQHIATARTWGAHNYEPLPVVLSEGEGAWVTDVEGKTYLDMLSAYSAMSFGHGHPELLATAREQLGRLTLTSRAFHNDKLPGFCRDLARLCELDVVLPMNTGAEAVETALKAARRWGYEVKNVPRDRARVVVFANNFHGRTITVVSMSTTESAYAGYGPLTPGFDVVELGDLAAVRDAITDETVAVLVEPIQGEGGVIVPPEGFMRGLRELCTEQNVLLLADEIQTGLGRTGELFEVRREGVQPDLLILGKALGGGLVPLSAVVGKREVMEVFTPGTHGSTFGGNPLAAAIGSTAVAILARGELVENARRLGAHLRDGLESIRSEAIAAIRGRGLLLAIELHESAGPARDVVEALLARGILCNDTKKSVIRLAPPLTVSRADLDFALERIDDVLGSWTS